MHYPLSEYLRYLLLTLAIEVPVVVLVLWRRCGLRRSLLAGVLASGITHPGLWYVWPYVVSIVDDYEWYVATGEAMVVLVETVVIHGVALGFRRRHLLLAFATSVLANAVSYGVGLLIQTLE